MRLRVTLVFLLFFSALGTACIEFPARPIPLPQPDASTIDAPTDDVIDAGNPGYVSSPSDVAVDSDADASPACSPACARPELCIDGTQCAACLVNSDCTESMDAPLCRVDDNDASQNLCVGCLKNDDCSDPTASRCDDNAGTCQACQDVQDCAHLDEELDNRHCIDGVCVQCTTATEVEDCDKFSCDRITKRCTQTRRDDVEICGECRASSECKAGHECVHLPERDASGGAESGRAAYYCLELFGQSGGCDDRFGAGELERDNIEGENNSYCGFNTAVTTCEAVTHWAKACMTDDDCGRSDIDGDGICTTINGVTRCSYRCTDSLECPRGVCEERSGTDKYCGPP